MLGSRRREPSFSIWRAFQTAGSAIEQKPRGAGISITLRASHHQMHDIAGGVNTKANGIKSATPPLVVTPISVAENRACADADICAANLK